MHSLLPSRLLFLGLMFAMALSACGQKGDLYLPEKTSAAPISPTLATG